MQSGQSFGGEEGKEMFDEHIIRVIILPHAPYLSEQSKPKSSWL